MRSRERGASLGTTPPLHMNLNGIVPISAGLLINVVSIYLKVMLILERFCIEN